MFLQMFMSLHQSTSTHHNLSHLTSRTVGGRTAGVRCSGARGRLAPSQQLDVGGGEPAHCSLLALTLEMGGFN